MNILALDLGTTLGWAMSSNGLITSGRISFKPQRFEGGGMVYVRFSKWLGEMNGNLLVPNSGNNIDHIYFEEVRRHLGVDAAHKYGGFLAHLTAFCERCNIPYLGVPVGTIKKHVTGKGNASKEGVIKAVQDMGYCPKDDNEADALALLNYVINDKVGI